MVTRGGHWSNCNIITCWYVIVNAVSSRICYGLHYFKRDYVFLYRWIQTYVNQNMWQNLIIFYGYLHIVRKNISCQQYTRVWCIQFRNWRKFIARRCSSVNYMSWNLQLIRYSCAKLNKTICTNKDTETYKFCRRHVHCFKRNVCVWNKTSLICVPQRVHFSVR